MPVSLYRVFSYLEGVPDHKPGGALFIPPQGAGRLDNPEHYDVLYVSSDPEAAVAESLAPIPSAVWTTATMRGTPLLPGSIRALARYALPGLALICDLDDPRQLLAHQLRPSTVITRDYAITQSWALKIFKAARTTGWVGVRWWSYYEGRWSSIGLWTRTALHVVEVVPLTVGNPAVAAAAKIVGRQIM